MTRDRLVQLLLGERGGLGYGSIQLASDFAKLLAEPCGWKIRITELVYFSLWIIAILLAVRGFAKYLRDPEYGLHFGFMDWWLTILFGTLTVVQQFVVMLDMHRIEDEPTIAKDDYDDWIGMRGERILRIIMISALLLGAGELQSAIYPAFDCELHVKLSRVCEIINPEGEYRLSFFIGGCFLLFLSLAVWNGVAWGLRKWRLKDETFEGNKEKENEAKKITRRILLFACSGVIGSVYWGAIAFAGPDVIIRATWLLMSGYLIVTGWALKLGWVTTAEARKRARSAGTPQPIV